MERSETETKQRYNNQTQRLEKEIIQLKKKLEQEVEQRHSLERNQDVSSFFSLPFLLVKIHNVQLLTYTTPTSGPGYT